MAQSIHVKNSSGYVVKYNDLQITNPIPEKQKALRTFHTLSTLYPSAALKLLRNGRRVKLPNVAVNVNEAA